MQIKHEIRSCLFYSLFYHIFILFYIILCREIYHSSIIYTFHPKTHENIILLFFIIYKVGKKTFTSSFNSFKNFNQNIIINYHISNLSKVLKQVKCSNFLFNFKPHKWFFPILQQFFESFIYFETFEILVFKFFSKVSSNLEHPKQIFPNL